MENSINSSLQRLARQVEEIRRARGLSRQISADLAGVNWHTIHRWERGENFPTLATAALILDVFGYELTITRKKGGLYGQD